jgi:TfoX/Sxy family transcriptional regulator of competence genes
LVYDNNLADRIEKIVVSWDKTDAKKMFGGICYLINGKMFSGVYKDYLILRLGENASKNALKMSKVKPFDITGRPMKGWIMVSKDRIDTNEKLKNWLLKAKEFTQNLPPKR